MERRGVEMQGQDTFKWSKGHVARQESRGFESNEEMEAWRRCHRMSLIHVAIDRHSELINIEKFICLWYQP